MCVSYPVQVGGGVVQMDPELLVHSIGQRHVLGGGVSVIISSILSGKIMAKFG